MTVRELIIEHILEVLEDDLYMNINKDAMLRIATKIADRVEGYVG